MSWCDKLASTPGVGFRLNYHFAPATALLEGFAPLLGKMVIGDKVNFTLEKAEKFNLNFATLDGFKYGVEPSKIHVTFQHSIRARAVSGGPPTMEMLSSPRPFTTLLPDVSRRLIEAALLLPNARDRVVTRVGVIAITAVGRDDLPPGISRFIEYLGRPWKALPIQFNVRVASPLGKTSSWTDRCIHTLTQDDDEDALLTLHFDWQRTFASKITMAQDALEDIMENAQKSALEYFEDLAEGSRFDESVIGNAT